MAKYNREYILEKGMEILQEEGYTGMSILRLLKACNIPKGSFYNFFDSKEDFVKEVLEYYNASVLEIMRMIDESSDMNAYNKIEKFFLVANEAFTKEGFSRTCPMLNITADNIEGEKVVSQLIEENFNSHKAYLRKWVQKGQEKNLIKNMMEVKGLVNMIYDSYHGAVMRLKYENSKESLDFFISDVLPYLVQVSKSY